MRNSRDHRRSSNCELCGQPILWAFTRARRWQPLDPEPNEDGNVLAYRDAHGVLRARALSTAEPGSTGHPWEKVYMPHQATCRFRLQHPPANVTPLRRWRRR